MLQYLRISVTALSLTACVLLVALWVRSYWKFDGISGKRGRHYVYFDVHSGRASFSRIVPSGQSPPVPWRAFSHSHPPITASDLEAQGSHRALGFQWKVFGNGWRVAVPLWFPVVTTAVLATLPWIRHFKSQFSLRTLLIATTLVAGGLGVLVKFAH